MTPEKRNTCFLKFIPPPQLSPEGRRESPTLEVYCVTGGNHFILDALTRVAAQGREDSGLLTPARVYSTLLFRPCRGKRGGKSDRRCRGCRSGVEQQVGRDVGSKVKKERAKSKIPQKKAVVKQISKAVYPRSKARKVQSTIWQETDRCIYWELIR